MNFTLTRIADRIDRGITDHTDADALRAAPAQARQPLTDEQLAEMRRASRLDFVTLREFSITARAIEAAHGIGDAA